ncbi:tyrosine-type recombinase/integrase [Billgrantia kenyensis]|uniref:Tyrosine-type recombinase/integrase n=1 Tax=Billgrantia kenyensis TaxID=321266 RepID=A0ABS9PQ52_9GAMM|nr:tyrosine-type recombinase/integrase [Halomonas kenyensis]MCG6663916.1 tyrosine-type recombinase/integrase [Halomonas kenyensis]
MTEVNLWKGWSLTQLSEKPADGEAARTRARLRQRYKAELAALKLLSAYAPELVEGHPEADIGNTRIAHFFDQLAAEASGMSLPKQHNFIVRGLEKGVRELGWQVSIPSPMVTVPRQAPAVRSSTMEQLVTWEGWAEKHLEVPAWPTEYGPSDQAIWSAGRLVFSLIHDGSVLNRQWLAALPDAIADGIRSDAGRNEFYLTLCRQYSSGKNDRQPSKLYRRIFLSPLTSLLLWQHYDRCGRSWPKNASIEKCLRSYCRSLTQEKLPSALLSIALQAGETSASLELPPILVHYARKLDLAPSLSPSSWQRLLTGRVPKLSDLDLDLERVCEAQPNCRPLVIGLRQQYPDQLRQLRQLQSEITRLKGAKRPTHQVIEQRLDAFLSPEQGNGPMVIALAEWSRHLLVFGGVVKSRLKPRSVATYLSSIARPLVIHTQDDHDLTQFQADDWQRLYERCLSEARGDDGRTKRARRLRDFHDYLILKHRVPDVDLEVDRGIAKRVDVNILTVAEYDRALKLIHDSDQPERFREMQALTLIIGYRCGLRRSECASLLIRDITYETTATGAVAELIVRPNGYHTGKSESATRRLPLGILLTQAEWQRLRRWVARRNAEGLTLSANRELLFCEQGYGLQPLWDDVLFKPIQMAMKLASGDASLRYHHLRHSFVTFTLLRLMEDAPEALFPKAWATDDQGSIAMPHWCKDISAMAWLAPREETTRKRLWLLALWAGHAGPHETLASYSHLADWVAGETIRKLHDPILSNREQATLLGQSPRSVPVWRSRHKITGAVRASDLLQALSAKPAFTRLTGPATSVTASWHTFRNPDLSALSWKGAFLDTQPVDPVTIYQCLRLIGQLEAAGETHSTCISRTATRLDVSKAALEGWVREGERLMNLKTARGQPRFSRCRDPEKRQQLAVSLSSYLPELPRSIAPPYTLKAQLVARTYFHALLDWYQREPETCRESLNTYRDAMQRTTAQLKFSTRKARQAALRLLRWLHLEQHVQVVVERPPHVPREKVVAFWREETRMTRQQIVVVESTTPNQTSRHSHGKAAIRLSDPDIRGHKQPLELLPALRFAIFMALVVTRSQSLAAQEAVSPSAPPAEAETTTKE